MKILVLIVVILYLLAIVYLYFFQTSIVFNSSAIEAKEPFSLKDTKNITLDVEDALLDGVYKSSNKKNTPLILYFGGNADDATRIVLHTQKLEKFDIVAFNYRGYVKSSGIPSQNSVFKDALSIYDRYAKDREVIAIGRSLGTGVATYLASKRDIKGVILITPYDSILSIAQKQYPIFPIKWLLKHKFESIKYIQNVAKPVGLIEVVGDEVVTKYHFDKLKDKVPNIALHISLENTTHGDVLVHPDFQKSLLDIIERF